MEQAQYDFGHALSINAEAVGQPGQRDFRLLVKSASQTASIWMEKQQLGGIATWLDETLEKLDREKPSDEPDVQPLPIDGALDLDFRISQIGLGYSEDDGLFTIHVFDQVMARGKPVFSCQLSRGQCRVLSRTIVEVVAGGRPICPLCDIPMDPSGHVCPKANGHHKVGV